MSASEAAGFAVLVLVSSSCTTAVAVPDPPDMSSLVASYGEPKGTFDTKHPGAVLDQGSVQLGVLAGTDMSSFLTDIMASLAARLDATGLGTSDDSGPTRVDAVLSLELACPSPDSSIEITTVLEKGRLSRVLWGTAKRCTLGKSASHLALDGSVSIYRYAPLSAPASEASFLVRVEGTVSEGGTERRALDFRVNGGAAETRVPAVAGDVIVARHGTDLAIRAVNGTFTCSMARRSCR